MGIRANGTMYSWGDNFNGQLGINITIGGNRSSPVLVAGGLTDWIQVSAGNKSLSGSSLAIRATGQLYSWGSNQNGILGDNTVVARSSPVLVAGGFTNWIQASLGFNHSLAIRATGQLYSWGGNNSGHLGHNTATTVSTSSPVLVAGGFTDWVQASAGNTHSLGIRATGQLYAWGLASSGILGDNTVVTKSSPVLVVGGFTDWVQSSSGSDHNLGLRAG